MTSTAASVEMPTGTTASGAFTAHEATACILTRLVLTPAVHIAIVALTRARTAGAGNGGGSGGFADPLALVLLLQAGMPSAISVQVIFQRGGVDTKPLGALMLWMYVLAAPAVVAQVVCASRVLS